jgi:hypothetical protein
MLVVSPFLMDLQTQRLPLRKSGLRSGSRVLVGRFDLSCAGWAPALCPGPAWRGVGTASVSVTMPVASQKDFEDLARLVKEVYHVANDRPCRIM